MKTCKRCGIEKPVSRFSPYARSRDGLFSWCKDCNCKLQKGRYARLSPTERAEINRHRRSTKAAQEAGHARQNRRYSSDPEYRARVLARLGGRTHGITAEEYLERRSRVCEICGVFKPSGKRGSGMHIDHDHSTGRLRGTLCDRCNRGLGMFSDDPERLRSAADYVLRYRV